MEPALFNLLLQIALLADPAHAALDAPHDALLAALHRLNWYIITLPTMVYLLKYARLDMLREGAGRDTDAALVKIASCAVIAVNYIDIIEIV